MQPRPGPRRGEGGLRINLGANGLDCLGPGSYPFLGRLIMALDDRARWDEKHAAEHATQKPGGWVSFETYLTNQSKISYPINPYYLLLHNEQLDFSRDFRILYNREG